MKFIPKKQTGGLVNRYLQANQYNLNAPIANRPVVPQIPINVAVNPAFAKLPAPTIATNGVYPAVQYPTGTWAHAAITGEQVPQKWQMPIAQAATAMSGAPATVGNPAPTPAPIKKAVVKGPAKPSGPSVGPVSTSIPYPNQAPAQASPIKYGIGVDAHKDYDF
jgi:hypothetical protein